MYFGYLIDKTTMEVSKLKSNVSDITLQVPKINPIDDETLLERIKSLGNEVFGANGRKIDYEHERVLSNRMDHLEERVRAGAGWLQLDITNDKSKSELDNVTYCIRSAAYQMLKKPE